MIGHTAKMKVFLVEACKLDKHHYKLLYFWVTECPDWGAKPRGIPGEMIEMFGQLGPWEKVGTIRHMSSAVTSLMEQDGDDLRDAAVKREEDEERAKEQAFLAAAELAAGHDWTKDQVLRDLTGIIERQIDQGAENVARHIIQCWDELGRE